MNGPINRPNCFFMLHIMMFISYGRGLLYATHRRLHCYNERKCGRGNDTMFAVAVYWMMDRTTKMTTKTSKYSIKAQHHDDDVENSNKNEIALQ